MQDIFLTKQGIEDLQAELKHLKEVERPAITQELKEARAQGDLSENADYDAARNKQAQVESRIRELEAMLSNAKVISEEELKGKNVKLGQTVVLEIVDTKEKREYTIVGTVEANPSEGKISNECPLARAILDKPVGSIVTVICKKPYKVQIVEIKR